MGNDILWDSANEFLKIKDSDYLFTAAKNGKAINISLRILQQDYTHIIGLDHLSDKPRLNTRNSKIKSYVFDDIISGKITLNSISTSKYFNEPFPSTYNDRTKAAYTLTERIEASKDIGYYLDNAYKGKLYKWDKRKSFIKMPDGKVKQSLINADYMFAVPSKTNANETMYIFMYEKNGDKNIKQLCIHSAFLDCLDLSQGQERPYTILSEEKVNTKTKQTTQVYTRPGSGSANIMKIRFDNNHNNTELFSLNTNGAAVLNAPRPTLGQALAALINGWADKIRANTERRRQETERKLQEADALKDELEYLRSKLIEKKEENVNLKNEIQELRSENAQLIEQNKKQLIPTAAKQTKSFAQGLEEFAKRPKGQSSPKHPAHDSSDHKHRK